MSVLGRRPPCTNGYSVLPTILTFIIVALAAVGWTGVQMSPQSSLAGPAPGPFAYVANNSSGQVSGIDLTTETEVLLSISCRHRLAMGTVIGFIKRLYRSLSSFIVVSVVILSKRVI